MVFDENVKLLLVDDEERNLDALEVILESSGCSFVRARSADEALLALLHNEFAAIILDIRMPGTGGLELAQLIKARKRNQHIPILFLTAHMMDEKDVLQAYGVGAVDYLSKPINPEILRSKVAVFIDLFRTTRALGRAVEALHGEINEREAAQAELRTARDQLELRVVQRTEELAEANRALLDADRRKNEFLATLAHELRNPLAPIRYAVQVLHLQGPTTPELRWVIQSIDRQTQHMARLIDDLLDVNRITRNMLELKKERVDLESVINAAVETSQPLIERGRHRLTVDLPSCPVYLNADFVRLSQVFANLLNNAAKYGGRGGEGGGIWLSANVCGAAVVVRVRDEGIGIAENMLPRVFDMFTQVGRSLEQSEGGLGIGLALAKRLVEMHEGRIEVRSEGLGKGSEFIVRLPVAQAEMQPIISSAPLNQREPSKRRILIADDNADVVEAFEVMLHMLGHEVMTAHDGRDAVEKAEHFMPDVVVLDIGMPVLNGYDAAQQIRNTTWGRNMTLIALTGWGDEKDKQKSQQAGFNIHLVKPVDPLKLTGLLDSLPDEGLQGRTN